MTIREASIRIKQIDNDIELIEDSIVDNKEKELNKLFNEKEKLDKWIIRELRIIGEYEPLKAKIIMLREQKHFTWDKISDATNYSKRQCINIYNSYIDKRIL